MLQTEDWLPPANETGTLREPYLFPSFRHGSPGLLVIQLLKTTASCIWFGFLIVYNRWVYPVPFIPSWPELKNFLGCLKKQNKYTLYRSITHRQNKLPVSFQFSGFSQSETNVKRAPRSIIRALSALLPPSLVLASHLPQCQPSSWLLIIYVDCIFLVFEIYINGMLKYLVFGCFC